MNDRHVSIVKKKNGKEVVLRLKRLREIIETEDAIKIDVETRLNRMLFLRGFIIELNLNLNLNG